MVAYNKIFDALDFPNLQAEMAYLEQAMATKHKECIAGRSQMRWWEYCWLMHASGVKPGMRVLDIGADHSGFIVALALMGCEAYAVDVNVDEHIGNWWSRMGVNWIRHDVMRLPFCNKFFDRTFSVCVGEHIGDTTCMGWAWSSNEQKLFYGCDMLVRESIRVLKTDGISANTFDFGAPPMTQKCGFDPESATRFVCSVPGTQVHGGVDYAWKSRQRNIPGPDQNRGMKAHTVASFLFRRTY